MLSVTTLYIGIAHPDGLVLALALAFTVPEIVDQKWKIDLKSVQFPWHLRPNNRSVSSFLLCLSTFLLLVSVRFRLQKTISTLRLRIVYALELSKYCSVIIRVFQLHLTSFTIIIIYFFSFAVESRSVFNSRISFFLFWFALLCLSFIVSFAYLPF